MQGTKDFKVTAEHLNSLPEPIQRYMRFSNVLDKPWIHSVRLTQSGRFRTAVDRPWMSMHAVQTYTTQPPTFRWDARFKLFGLPLLRALDQYESGHGHMFGKLAGIFPLFDARGEELDQGAMLRYLSEMIWFPTAFLGENISWQAVDDQSVNVTFSDYGKSVTAQLFIDEVGRLTNITAMRYREAGGDFTLDPWSTPITRYGEMAGLNLPIGGQAVWNLPSGDLTYVDLEITDIIYDLST